jgi:two-component system OmpR family sensor kinase
MRTVSLKRRVSLASLAVLAVALVAFDAFLYVSFDRRLTGDLRHQLSERFSLARSLANELPPQELAQRLATDGVTAQVIAGGRRYVARPPAPPAPMPRARPPSGARPAPPPGARARKPAVATPPASVAASATGPAAAGAAGALTLSQPLAGGERLVLSVSRSQLQRDLAGLLLDEAAGSVAVLLAAALALYAVLGRALAPLDRTTAVAAAIARGQARSRLNPQRTDTELGRMASAFDAMLDRLEAALAAARASEERMRRFLADAAHELRTPIQALQAGAETLLREAADEGERAAPGGIDWERVAVQMVRDAARAGRLVGDLLTLGRLDQDPALKPERFDLGELAREQLARAEVLAPNLHLRYEGPLRCPVEADRDRVAQVLVNLLDNARHATPDGGTVTLAIDANGVQSSRASPPAADRRVGDAPSPAAGEVRVTVADAGPGVPPNERERIFERFVRLDPSRSRSAFGSGLGLAIARRIAEAHGGSLRCIEPPAGAGACFELRLPRAPERQGAGARRDGAGPRSGGAGPRSDGAGPPLSQSASR